MKKKRFTVTLIIVGLSAILALVSYSLFFAVPEIDERTIGASLFEEVEYRYPGSNVLLISIDTLRPDHLGCYGYERNTSPNIDGFSRDSVLFRENIAQAPSTEPSHASILTSLNPLSHGAFLSMNRPIPREVVTMAEVLKKRRYKTVSFNGGGQIIAELGFDQGFDIYDSSSGDNGRFRDVVDLAMTWLENITVERFFMFLHTYETHHPYTPDKAFLDLFDDYSGPLPDHISFDLLSKINDKKIPVTEADVAHVISAYDAEIRSMDEAFGVLVEYLKRRGLYGDMIIIFTSDHGEEFFEHGTLGWHGHTLFDEVIKVPLIIKLPKGTYADKTIFEQTRNIDILPTVLGVLNADIPDSFEGVNLIDWFMDETNRELFAVSQLDFPKVAKNKEVPLWRDRPAMKYTVMRSKKWKYYGGRLFDLEADPEEKANISGMHKGVAKAYKAEVEKYLENTREVKSESVDLSSDAIEQLKALGYAK